MRHWDGIEAFVTVVQQGSFKAAAEQLRVSSSHVSRLINKLESHLGITLIHRTTRTIRLSEAGERYHRECSRLLRGFTDAVDVIGEQQVLPVGLLKITCGTTFGERYIAPLLPHFLARYPKLRVDLDLNNTRQDVIRDNYDIAIRMGTMNDSSLLSRRLCDRKEYVCATQEYLSRHGTPHTLGELSQHNCLQGTSPFWLFMENDQRREIRVKGNWRSNSGPAVLEAVKAGLGIAQLPDYYVEPLFKSGHLISLLDRYCFPFSGVWLVYPKVHQQSMRARLLCDFLIESFKQAPWKQAPPLGH